MVPDNEIYKEWRKLGWDEKNFARGLWGEYSLNKSLNNEFGAIRFQEDLVGEHYAFLFDRIEIPSYGGKTTEIDSLMVTQKGVFCFEVKSWSGDAIFGEEDGDAWFSAKSNDRRGAGVRSHKTGNPFKQNAYHIRCLKNLLPDIVAERATFGMIVVLNASPFCVKPARWEGGDIDGLFTSVQDVVAEIKQKPIILSAQRVEDISLLLGRYEYGSDFRSMGPGRADVAT
jgi:hypothetical protein